METPFVVNQKVKLVSYSVKMQLSFFYIFTNVSVVIRAGNFIRLPRAISVSINIVSLLILLKPSQLVRR